MKSIIQRHTRQNNPVAPALASSNVVRQNLKREKIKIPNFSSTNLLKRVETFTHDREANYYLGFGGLGDALLLMATCYNDPKAKVIFFANQIPFINEFFNLLGIPVYLHENIMGTKIASHIYNFLKNMPNFRESAHLADGLNYNDWTNENKYIKRIKNTTDWLTRFGKEQADKPIAIIAPSGSNKDIKRQRYLNHNEYNQLVEKTLKNYLVYVVGSVADLHHFKLINKSGFNWLCSDRIYSGDGVSKASNLKNMLRIINSAEHVLSMDTWLKTYSLLCGIPTTVIKTRWDNHYRNYGEDITDWIFLNPNIWSSIKLTTIEALLATL